MSRPLRIAVVGGSLTKGGGASQVARDLVKALCSAGPAAVHIVAEDAAPHDPASRPIYANEHLAGLAQWAERKLRRYGLPHALPLDLPFLLTANLRHRFDILHFHDLGPGMSPLTIGALSRLMPVAWTFHDCAPFTGGCTYPMACTKYLTRCGTDGGCPQLGTWPMGDRYDVTGGLQAMRQFAHRRGRIHTIAPTDWLADRAVESGTLPTRPHVISNGVDLTIFRPAADRQSLRQELGLPTDRPIVLLTAAIASDRRKGLNHAIQALHALIAEPRNTPTPPPLALVIGKPDAALAAALAPIPHHATGHIADRTTLARWYAAADLQLNCSLAEVQGLVVLEAMACAVATIGFATGGMPASIEQGRSGYLVPPLDMPSLHAALRHAIQPGIAAAWGAAARQRVETHFSLDRFRDRHLTLYADMLNRQPLR